MKIVLDTNCLLPSIFKQSIYHWLWKAFRNGTFTLCYTTEILQEYEEVFSRYYTQAITENVMQILSISPNVEKVTVFFKWNLITADPDDNKFVDCLISAGAQYLVTNDKHFNVLEKIPFPKIQIVDIESFKKLIK
jgi:putative PIN family toxin of toxin-antitoxin system